MDGKAAVLTAINELEREKVSMQTRHAAELEQVDETITALAKFAGTGHAVGTGHAKPAGVFKPGKATTRTGRKYPALKCADCPRTFKGQAWLDKHKKSAHG